MGFELFLFLTLGIVAIASASLMIIVKNAVHSALFLIMNFGCVALLYLMLDAPFISMVQIAVYAGAIMVLFLFVIMLLGAEQTTDTESRQFGWLTGAAVVLVASVLFAIAIPLVLSGGIQLADAPGANPVLRVVHAANVPGPVNITLASDVLEEDVVIENATYGAITDFSTLPAGDYTVTVALAQNGAPLLNQTLTLAPDQVVTVLAYGEFSTSAQTFAITTMTNSFADPGDNHARMVAINTFSADPLYLVDLGGDSQLDVAEGAITDIVLAELPFGVSSVPFTHRQGNYDLAFYRQQGGEFVSVYTLNDWALTEGTEQTLLLVQDYEAPNTGTGYPARVLDFAREKLLVRTNDSFGGPGGIGRDLFTVYLLPVNIVGFLLLVALVGVIVLTRPEGASGQRRSTINRRRKVNRPLVNVISQQTGNDVIVDTPKLEEPASGD